MAVHTFERFLRLLNVNFAEIHFLIQIVPYILNKHEDMSSYLLVFIYNRLTNRNLIFVWVV